MEKEHAEGVADPQKLQRSRQQASGSGKGKNWLTPNLQGKRGWTHTAFGKELLLAMPLAPRATVASHGRGSCCSSAAEIAREPRWMRQCGWEGAWRSRSFPRSTLPIPCRRS